MDRPDILHDHRELEEKVMAYPLRSSATCKKRTCSCWHWDCRLWMHCGYHIQNCHKFCSG